MGLIKKQMKFLGREKQRTVIIVLLFLVTVIALHYGHILRSDEGVVLNAAWNLFNGKVLHVDFFEYISPGTFSFVWLLFLAFEPSYLVVQLVSLAVYLVSVFLFYKISATVFKKNIAMVATYLWLLLSSLSIPIINHNTYSTAFFIFTCFTFLKFLEEKKSSLLILSGILAGLTFYFLQTKGIAIILVLVAYIVYLIKIKKLDPKSISIFATGVAGVFLLGLYFWGVAVWSAPIQFAQSYLFSNPVSMFLVVLAFLLTAFLYLYLAKRYPAQKDRLLLFTILQMALFLSILNRPDIYHIFLNAFFLMLMIVVFVYNILQPYQDRLPELRFMYLGFVLFIFLTILLRFAINFEEHQKTKVFLSDLSIIVQNEKIFVTPFMPGIYFELRKNNPYYTSVLETLIGDQGLLERNFGVLKNESPQFIITNYKITGDLYYEKNEVDAYIEKNYIAKKYYRNGAIVWEKKGN